MSKVKLARISSLDEDYKIIYGNYLIVHDNASKIIDILYKANWIDRLTLPSHDDYADNNDRSFYLWRKSITTTINNIITEVSNVFNEEGLYVPPDYNELQYIELWMPEILVYSQYYFDNMNSNFSKVETRINDFYKILEDAKLIKSKEYRQIDIVGDSITYGMGASTPSKDYVSVLEKEIRIPIKNDGVSSATIQNGSNNDQISFINHVKKIDFSKSDIVIVFGGTNDFAQSLPVGKSTDATDKSLIGALKTVINQIKKSNPNALVLIIPPMWRARINDSSKFVDINTVPNSAGVLFKEYFNAVVKIAKDYKIPYLDLFNNSEINQKNYKDYLADGLHPNDKGHLWLANKVHNFILNNVETPNNLK